MPSDAGADSLRPCSENIGRGNRLAVPHRLSLYGLVSDAGLVAKQRLSAVEHSCKCLADLQQSFRGVTFLDLSLHLRPVRPPKCCDAQPHGFVEGAGCSVCCLEHTVDYQGFEANHVQGLSRTELNHGHGTIDLAIRKFEQPAFPVREGVLEMVSLEMSKTKVGERLSIRTVEVGAHVDVGGSVRTCMQVDGRPTHKDSIGFDCEIGGSGEPETPPDLV